MTRLAILGASGHGKVVADAALAAGWRTVAFFDDAWPGLSVVGPWPVIGDTAALHRESSGYDGAIVAIGDNATRLFKQRALAQAGITVVSVIHPAATISVYAHIGPGTLVCAGVIVNPFARLGHGCILNTASSVDHDCELSDGVHLSPGAHLGGAVRVGEASWIGIGASVRHCVAIGAGVVVGGGAVVVGDIADGLTVMGIPARTVQC